MNHKKPFWTISSEIPVSASTTFIRKAWHLRYWRPRMVRTPCLSTGEGPQLWGSSKCQHRNRRSRVWEKCRNSMYNMVSKDIPSTVIPTSLQSPEEGQMPTPSFLPSMDARCTARSFHHKPSLFLFWRKLRCAVRWRFVVILLCYSPNGQKPCKVFCSWHMGVLWFLCSINNRN